MQTYQVSHIRHETHAFGRCHAHTHSNYFLTHWGQTGNLFFKLTTMHCQIACVYQKRNLQYLHTALNF